MDTPISIQDAKEALDNMDDFARMAGIDPIGPRSVLEQFIAQVEAEVTTIPK